MHTAAAATPPPLPNKFKASCSSHKHLKYRLSVHTTGMLQARTQKHLQLIYMTTNMLITSLNFKNQYKQKHGKTKHLFMPFKNKVAEK
jgi:hypothetical protein